MARNNLQQFFLLLLFSLWHTAMSVCPGSGTGGPPIPLYFGYMAAVSPNSSYVTGGTIPAVQLALEIINNNSSLLNGYRLSYNETVFDSQCDRGIALGQFFSMINNKPPYYIAALAAGCSVATQPVAELTHYWNLPVVSYASSAPELSNREQFPSFFRIYPSDSNFVPAFVGLVKGFGWSKVCVFTEEQNLFLQNERPLMEQLREAGVYSDSFTFAPTSDVSSMVRDVVNSHNDTHIFFINSYEGPGRAIMCQFYKLGLRYPAYSFITHGWYSDQWWLGGNSDCNNREFAIQLNRVIAIQQYPFAANRSLPTYSGLTVNQFDTKYNERLSLTDYDQSIEAHNAFDGMWTLAIALDRVQRAVCNNDTLGCDIGPLTHLEDYQYYNAQVECMLNNSLNMTSFEGVSGYVRFDVNGTRQQDVFSIFQYQSTQQSDDSYTVRRQLIGVLDIGNNYTFVYQNSTPVWPEGIPPDGTIQRIINTIHVSLLVIFYTVAIIGIVLSIFCLVFNFVFRNKKIIKLTSPNVNYVISVGALMMYTSVIFLLLPGLDEYSLNLRCSFGYWLGMVGYMISFSAVLAKMWRVYYIFHNPTASKRTLKDWHLLIIVAVSTLIFLLLLLIGEAIPQTRHTPTLISDGEQPSTKNALDVIQTYFVYRCYQSTVGIAYQALIMAFLFILQVIGIVLAFQTRKVKVKILNDAKQVTAIIYITSVCVVVIIMSTFALGSFLNVSSALFCCSIATAATAILLLIFIPKMISLYKDPEGKEIFSKSKGSTLPAGIPGAADTNTMNKDSLGMNIALATLGEDPKAQILTLQAKVAELQEELKRQSITDDKRPSILPQFFRTNRTPSIADESGSSSNSPKIKKPSLSSSHEDCSVVTSSAVIMVTNGNNPCSPTSPSAIELSHEPTIQEEENTSNSENTNL